MDAQSWQAVFTLIIAVVTLVYTIGTFLLWRSTRDALRLNIVMALRDEPGFVSPENFTTLLRGALPKEAGKLISHAVGLGVKEALRRSSQ